MWLCFFCIAVMMWLLHLLMSWQHNNTKVISHIISRITSSLYQIQPKPPYEPSPYQSVMIQLQSNYSQDQSVALTNIHLNKVVTERSLLSYVDHWIYERLYQYLPYEIAQILVYHHLLSSPTLTKTPLSPSKE